MELRHPIAHATLWLVAGAAHAATLPAGSYGCYTYNPRAIYVGEIGIAADRYSVPSFGTTGTYTLDSASGSVAWRGKPPLGFEAAALETDPVTGRRQLRMYPKASDIGNKWKAALCTPKEGSAAASTGATSTGASAAATSAPAGKGAGFKPGDRVTAEFIGVPYPATVVAAEPTRVRLHYDDPKSKDEWVDINRVKPKK